ncbi:MAG: VOC family protein [Prolixibacteraceae bacterium]|jgi:hypothetical protein|nr:VOC family protein [Prolixibacteraceae bacterium]
MESTENALNWFEIAVNDISRAKKFYETVFGIEMHSDDMMGMKMAVFVTDDSTGKVSGALVQSDMHKPSADGVTIYLNGNPDLDLSLGRVNGAGGKVLLPKTLVNEDVGYMAFFMDTEGNKIGLHSRN